MRSTGCVSMEIKRNQFKKRRWRWLSGEKDPI
jgi:hypothetical protein